MNSQMTVEELKALQVGDWVWVEFENFSTYVEKTLNTLSLKSDDEFYFYISGKFNSCYYFDYGKKWTAYKNKEQAEARDVVELPYLNKPEAIGMPTFQVVSRSKYNSIMVETFYEEGEAQARLAELRGENE